MHCMLHGQVGGLLSGALLRELGQPGFFEGQDQVFFHLAAEVGCRYNNTCRIIDIY